MIDAQVVPCWYVEVGHYVPDFELDTIESVQSVRTGTGMVLRI
jgi:hypothetical protein